MSKSKRFCIGVLSALLAALLLCAGTVFVVDPLQVYRQATWYTPLIDYVTQVYSNAGIAKHYSYDSAIVGTSLTENSAPSLYDELFGGEWIKLVTSGGTAHNHAILMDVAFRTREMKRIVYGLDIYSFIAEKDETAQYVPMYLYDDNPFNDVYYLLNKDLPVQCRGPDLPDARQHVLLGRQLRVLRGGGAQGREPDGGRARPVGHQ